MNRVVAFTYPDPSHVQSMLPVYAELVRRGERLTLYSTDAYRAWIEGVGATFRLYEGTMAPSSTGPFGGLQRRLAFGEQVLPEALSYLERERPDYVITDVAAVWGQIAANLLQLPAASYRVTFALHRDMLDTATLIDRFYGAASREFVLQGMRDLAAYYETAQRLDARYASRTADIAECLECRCGLNLVLYPKALQIESERFDETYRFVGHCYGATPAPDNFPWDRLGESKALYISLGTVFNNRPEFYRACFEAFADWPARVVMPVGRRVDIASLGPIPSNFLVAPHYTTSIVTLLERCNLAITHGGANTVEECVRAGVPQLLYPQAGDQFVLSELIENAGAGIRLSDADLTATRLRDLAERLVADSRYAAAAESLGRAVRVTGGTSEAADAITAYAATACAALAQRA